MKHIFAVCAYRESPYLTQCLDSLRAQTEPSEIILCTATPSPVLERTAAKYGIAYLVNDAAPDIAGDWNFAAAQAKARGADCVTLCHQDDLYLPDYGRALRTAAEKYGDITIWFSAYGEQRGETRRDTSKLLRIKRLLLWRLKLPFLQGTRWAKRGSLAYGDPICCPAVTYALTNLELPLFEHGYTSDLDWQAWEKLSTRPGRFCYDSRVLMLHRIHEGSETSKILGAGERRAQDLAMFRRFWPEGIARLLARAYSRSEKSNEL